MQGSPSAPRHIAPKTKPISKKREGVPIPQASLFGGAGAGARLSPPPPCAPENNAPRGPDRRTARSRGKVARRRVEKQREAASASAPASVLSSPASPSPIQGSLLPKLSRHLAPSSPAKGPGEGAEGNPAPLARLPGGGATAAGRRGRPPLSPRPAAAVPLRGSPSPRLLPPKQWGRLPPSRQSGRRRAPLVPPSLCPPAAPALHCQPAGKLLCAQGVHPRKARSAGGARRAVLTSPWPGCRTGRCCCSCLCRTCLQRAPTVTHLSTHHSLPGNSPVTMETPPHTHLIGRP